ncbi:MAG: hypothetical protein JJU12_08180 [Chlamydiales bacterium]|nr:hypothetical protein [Chlamydiales bacterium]
MGRFIVYFSLLASLCASCAPRCRDTTLYQSSGRHKAIVAVLPVIDNSQGVDLSWDLSKEFTEEIRKHVYDSPELYLLREHGTREIAERLNTPNPSMISQSLVNDLGAAEFVVVAELIDQSESPCIGRFEETGCMLNTAMRVRVLDLRHDKPKVILQEVIDHNHFVPRVLMAGDCSKTPWGTEAFKHTPLGLVHNKIVREVVGRVESYIEAAR